MAVKEGKPAPDFTLKDQQGQDVSLADFKGSNIIVYFYPRDNTPGCTKEAQGFRDLWKKFTKENTVILGISPDKAAAHQKFIADFNLPFILLSDPEKTVMKKYGAFGEKVKDGKKIMGVIRSTVWIGPDLNVRKHWKLVAKAAEHPAEVCECVLSAD